MKSSKWYEKYLPFVARSLGKQVEWLQNALHRSLKDLNGGRALSLDEIQPYVRLLLEDDGEERRKELSAFLQSLDDRIVAQMLRAADIYDATTLFGFLSDPVVEHAAIVLLKEPPPHEKSPNMVTDKLFLAVHSQSPDSMEKVSRLLQKSKETPPHFEKAYSRFREMVMDEEVLSLLFPKAKA